jgi:hypothetical protein
LPRELKAHPDRATSDSTPDRAWAERVAARLRGELGNLLQTLEPAQRRATAMARLFDLQVPLCHRVVAGVRESGPAGQVLGAFPGVEGLRMFLNAARSAGCPAKAVASAAGAVDEFESLIVQSGGSQRRLVAALLTPGGEGAGALVRQRRNALALEDARRRGFEALVEQIGCVADTLVVVRVYAPAATPRFAGDLDVTGAIGRVGFTRTSAGMPFMIAHHRSPALDDPGKSGSPAWSLMEEFCTTPLPRVVLEERGDVRFGVVDPNFEVGGPIDIFAGPFTGRHVVIREGSSLYLNAGTKCSSPAEWLVTDVYVPRAWATDLGCAAGVYRAGILGDVSGPTSRRWFDRLPITLTPGLLGRGLAGAEMERFDRHAEFTTRVFEGAGVDPRDFTGFRLSVHYPMMEVQYVLSFEHEEDPEPSGGAEPATP